MEITPRGFEKAIDKLTSDQLDRNVGEVVVEPSTESAPETVIEPVVEAPVEPVVEPTEEEKVPKSRFLTMHQRAIEAEKALRTFEAERANTPVEKPVIADDADLKKFYTDTFGEGELTDKLYANELARLASIEEKAAERAFERFNNMGKEQEEVINQRVASMDAAFEELGVLEGKEFTDDEQVALLDIVEKYSPKDKDGMLIGDFLMPLDQAYEIFQIQQNPATQAKREERNKVASLSGARSEGVATASTDADWQPGQDRRWWNKVSGKPIA